MKSTTAVWREALLFLAASLLPAVTLPAADPVFDAKGFSPQREFFSQLPFEHVDPMTGNVLLTFTDLELPGNAGFTLRIQRTYNSKIYESYSNLGSYTLIDDSWAGYGWSLHLGRVINANPGPSDPGPVIEMPDGSRHQAYLHMDGVSGHYITKDWWTYERAFPFPVVRLPNGVKYTFGHFIGGSAATETLGVTRIEDTFGNLVTIEYAPPPAPGDVISKIVQHLNSYQTREITFTFNPTLPHEVDGDPIAAGSLRTMEFDGRTWTYEQKRMPYIPYTLLTGVKPPVGPGWAFSYDEGPAYGNPAPWILRSLTTPSGGEIAYVYKPQLFLVGSGAIYTPSLYKRTASGPGIETGTWTYTYQSTDWREPVVSEVASPCGTTTRYTFKAIGPYGNEEPWAIGSMVRKDVIDAGNVVLERTDLEWEKSAPISPLPESGNSFSTHVALLQTRSVLRAGSSQVYKTTNTYDGRAYRFGRASNFNDFGRPMEVLEEGELVRTTTRTFFYGTANDPSFATFLTDKTASETVQVGTETFSSSWKYEPKTGFLRSQTLNGITTTFTPDDLGNVATVKDAKGNVTRFTYEWGVVKNTSTPEYDVTREINLDGTVASETRRQFTTRFQYDALFRPTLLDPPLGNSVVTTYDNDTGRTTVVTHGPSVLTTEVNGFGQNVKASNGVNVTTVTEYDACGRPRYQSYPFLAEGGGTPNIGTRTQYDGLGRPTRRTHPDNTFVRFQYTGVDATITDEQGRVTTQNWSAFGDPASGRLVSVTDADLKTTSYDYNALGNLTGVTSPEGGARKWVYNDKNQLESETHPENGTILYTYDPVGNVLTRQDAQFGLSQLAYDRNNRLKGIDRPGEAYDSSITYDDSDNRKTVRNGHVDSTFTYDAVNRVKTRLDRIGGREFETTYDYDDNGNLDLLIYPSGGRVTYEPDQENRITRVANGGSLNFATNFKYHPSGALDSFRAGNGLVHNFRYDNRYRLKTLNSGGKLSLTYDYYDVGNVWHIKDGRHTTSTTYNQGFTYDALDRLRLASGSYGALEFTYDALGNRRTKTGTLGDTAYTYEASSNRLVSASGVEPAIYSYDLNGNTIADAAGLYTHTPVNQIETATVGGDVTTYRYDADDLRTVKVRAGETRYYIHGPGGQILSEFVEQNGHPELVRDYVYAGSRLLASIKPAVLSVLPSSVVFGAVLGGPEPALQSLLVELTGASGAAWTATASSAGWLSVLDVAGTSPGTLRLRAKPTGLAIGSYQGAVTVKSKGAAGSPTTIAVKLVVSGAPELVAVPGGFSFFIASGGGSKPPMQSLLVTYTGEASVAWTATSSAPWLSLAPPSGDTPGTVTLRVDGTGLAKGTYTDTVVVEAPGVPDSVRSIPVELVVQSPGGEACDPEAWYCEAFDGLDVGDLDGQGGWARIGNNATGQVQADPRGAGRALVLEAPDGGFVKDSLALAPHPIEGSDFSVQVMTRDVNPGSKSVAKIQYLTSPGDGWAKNHQTFATIRVGAQMVFQYGETISQSLMPMQSGRWYEVRLSYEGGQVHVYVDGQLKFSTESEIAPSLAFQGYSNTAWPFPGLAAFDMIQARGSAHTGGGRVVEPQAITLSFDPPSCSFEGATAAASPSSARGAMAKQPPSRKTVRSALPLAFEPNRGQAKGEAAFVSHGRGYGLWLARTELALALQAPEPARSRSAVRSAQGATTPTRSSVVRVAFPGMSRNAVLEPLDELPGKSHYLVGDASKWRLEIPHYARVRYRGAYPGIDLLFYGHEGRLEYDFVVSPGADPNRIEMRLSGATSVSPQADGSLLIGTDGGDLRMEKPVIYQEIQGRRQQVQGRYVRRGANRIGFVLEGYDKERTVVIDPLLAYSTYFGGGGYDEASDVEVGSDGSVYLAGNTTSPDLPGAAVGGSGDAFLAKLSADGQTILYTTYFGGSGEDRVEGLGVSPLGEPILTGSTNSGDFPLLNPVQSRRRGLNDAFVAKLKADGTSLVFSTLLGGGGEDVAFDAVVDGEGNVTVAGGTTSSTFPTVNASQPGFGGGVQDGFVTSLDSLGGLRWSTFLGGSSNEGVWALAEKAGVIVAFGATDSSDFPFSRVLHDFDGDQALYVAEYGAGGERVHATLVSSSFFTAIETPQAVAMDGEGAVYLTGRTTSTVFPTTPGALQTTLRGDVDAFVMKLLPGGTGYAYSTLLGGSAADGATSLAVGTDGVAYVGGYSYSVDFPVPECLRAYAGGEDAFLAAISPDGTALSYASQWGGSGDDVILGLSVGGSGEVVAAGLTTSTDLPTVNALQEERKGSADAFVWRVDPGATLASPGMLVLDPLRYNTDEQQGTVGVLVKRHCGSSGRVSVDFLTEEASGKAWVNYLPTQGTLTFAEGEVSKVIPVQVRDDGWTRSCAGTPYFSLSLDPSTVTGGVVLGVKTAEVWIADTGSTDAPTGVISIAAESGAAWSASTEPAWLSLDSNEGTGPARVTVRAEAAGFGPGTYTGYVHVTVGGETHTVTITLQVLGNPE